MSSTSEYGVAAAGDLERLRDALAAQVADVTRLEGLGTPLASMIDIGSVLDEVLRAVATLLEADASVLRLYDPQSDRLVVRAALDLGEADLGPLARGEGIAGTVLATLVPVLIEDIEAADAPDLDMPDGYRGAYSTPMFTLGRELMGTLTLFFRTPFVPVESEIRLVESYARQTAEMVERARLHGEARQLAALEVRRSAQLRGLAETALALTPLTALDEILSTAADGAREVIGTRRASAVHASDGRATSIAVSGAREPVLGSPALSAPLRAQDGRNLGTIEVADKVDGTPFTGEDEAMLVQLAAMAAGAIATATLLERERTARTQAEEMARFSTLLSEASHAFSTSLELDETLGTITRITVPALADFCSVHLLTEAGTIELAIDASGNEHVQQVVRELMKRSPVRLDQSHGAGAAIRTSRTELFEELPDELLDAMGNEPITLEERQSLRLWTGIVAPLPVRGRTIGAMTLLRVAGGAYTAGEVAFAEDLARRAALAVDNATRYTLQRDVAAALQRSLLPQALPMAAALTAASRYLPGASGTQIGGDWYDLIELQDGRLGLVVGDVMGRGIPAAAIMGHLRAAVRAYALDGHGPADLLTRLDRVVLALGDLQLTTCLYGVFDPATGELTIAAAGHLPPLVLTAGEQPRFLTLEPNLPLGVGGATFVESTLRLPPGSTVLLYTDGLVEGPDCPVDEGMERLRLAAHQPVQSPDELCDRVLHALGRDGDHDDDTALLAVTLQGPALAGEGEGPYRLALPPAPESVASARVFVETTLLACGHGRHAEIAVLLVSELATNALRYGGGQVEVQVAVGGGTVRVDVRDESPDLPVMREELTVTDEGGRGVYLVEALSDRWGIERLPPGKRVWFELDVSPARAT